MLFRSKTSKMDAIGAKAAGLESAGNYMKARDLWVEYYSNDLKVIDDKKGSIGEHTFSVMSKIIELDKLHIEICKKLNLQTLFEAELRLSSDLEEMALLHSHNYDCGEACRYLRLSLNATGNYIENSILRANSAKLFDDAKDNIARLFSAASRFDDEERHHLIWRASGLEELDWLKAQSRKMA